MLKDKFQQFKEAMSDVDFQKKVAQQVVKAVVVTTAIAVTSAVLKYTEAGISQAFESKKELIEDVLSTNLIDA